MMAQAMQDQLLVIPKISEAIDETGNVACVETLQHLLNNITTWSAGKMVKYA